MLPGMREHMSAQELDKLGQAFPASRREHLGEEPADITKAEMEQQAENAQISGASGMSKAELKKTLEAAAEEWTSGRPCRVGVPPSGEAFPGGRRVPEPGVFLSVTATP